ncbi:MAG TPA: SCP2 sterol-binding domain-containing protein [Myxococcota bacterium]|jgi:hypothetical protein
MTSTKTMRITARRWFEASAAALVQAAPASFATGIGTALFEIGGGGGDDGGTFLVDFTARSVRRLEAGDPPAQPRVIVRAEARDFMALIEGRMSADDGILTKRLHVAGDVAAIAQLLGALVGKARP